MERKQSAKINAQSAGKIWEGCGGYSLPFSPTNGNGNEKCEKCNAQRDAKSDHHGGGQVERDKERGRGNCKCKLSMELLCVHMCVAPWVWVTSMLTFLLSRTHLGLPFLGPHSSSTASSSGVNSGANSLPYLSARIYCAVNLSYPDKSSSQADPL